MRLRKLLDSWEILEGGIWKQISPMMAKFLVDDQMKAEEEKENERRSILNRIAEHGKSKEVSDQ